MAINVQQRLENILSEFVDHMWRYVYEDNTKPSPALKLQLITDSRVKCKLHDFMNEDRLGGWVMATIKPKKEGFYMAEDDEGNKGMFHFYYGAWHSTTNKTVIKWFDKSLNKQPCPACKVKEWEMEEHIKAAAATEESLTARIKQLEKDAADIKRDMNFRLTHIIIRDEVLVALEKANIEIERLNRNTKSDHEEVDVAIKFAMNKEDN